MTLEYLAGLIEGEACFCFGVQRIAQRKGALRITPIFALYMKDKALIEEASEALKGHGLPVYFQERRKAGQWGIHASGALRVRRYCETFIPLMHGNKRLAAGLVQEFIDSRLAAPKNSGYTPREIEMVHELRSVNGNTRGRKNPLPDVGTLRDHMSGVAT